MELDQIIPAIFLIAVLVLVLPGFLATNNKIKQFLNNLSIWAIIVLIIVVIIYFTMCLTEKSILIHILLILGCHKSI